MQADLLQFLRLPMLAGEIEVESGRWKMIERELEVSLPKGIVKTLVIIALYFVLKRLKRIIQIDADLYCSCETRAAVVTLQPLS